MSVVNELFGFRLKRSGELAGKFREAKCPHMNHRYCDGGGNRDMTRWPSANQPLAPLFDPSVGKNCNGFIPCGVCSVKISGKNWAICPRRLLSLTNGAASPAQLDLRSRIFSLAGFSKGDKIRIWSEISLRDSNTGLNYRLDYVLKGDDHAPVIVEVMTASTSGGNKRKRTDMQSAFCDAVLYANGLLTDRNLSPGVNARQVWARMASQMIVKSEIANKWGGCTIWVVQDSLMQYIGKHTGLRLAELYSPEWEIGEVNVVSANIDGSGDIRLYSGPIQSIDGEACWTDLLAAPSIPAVESLTDQLIEDRAIASVLV